MYAAVVEPSKIAQVLGLRRKVTSIERKRSINRALAAWR